MTLYPDVTAGEDKFRRICSTSPCAAVRWGLSKPPARRGSSLKRTCWSSSTSSKSYSVSGKWVLLPARQTRLPASSRLLLEATRQSDVSIHVLITMRSDFLGDCAQFRDLSEAINDGLYLIPRMSRDQLRLAITAPAAVDGVSMTPRLIQELLNNIGDDPDQLPVLQHALMRMWTHWQNTSDKSRAVDLDDYLAVGGMAEALSRHANETWEGLSARGPDFPTDNLPKGFSNA